MARFTDRFIQNLEVKPERYDVRETDGFAVRVAPSGTKTWQFIYTFNAKKRRVTLGTYPGMSLKEAKDACGTLRDCLDRGVDPVEWQEEQDRQTAEAKRKEEQTATVAQLVDEYIERWAKPRKRTWPEDYRMLHKDVVPRWGKRKARDITRRDVLALLDGIVDRGAGIVANRTLEVVRRMFNYAIEQSILEVSPCNLVRAPAQEQRRDRVLSEDEIRVFWHGLDKAGMSEGSRIALRLLLVTAQRKSEIVEAPWSEFDLAAGWWTIPVERAKNKMAHRVPLSTGALALLTRAKELSGDSPYLFPSPRNTNAPVGGTSVDHALHRALATLGLSDVIPHDLRRTAASLMTGMGISRLVVSKILNHVEQGITAVYDRHSYDREKRQALDAWDRQLAAILAGTENNNVVLLRVATV
ncbi:MAG: tyrosine-type recombinase/integrase [Magnetococcus sp. YQC-3]